MEEREGLRFGARVSLPLPRLWNQSLGELPRALCTLRVGLTSSPPSCSRTLAGSQVFPPWVPWPRRAHKDMEGGCSGREGEREMK